MIRYWQFPFGGLRVALSNLRMNLGLPAVLPDPLLLYQLEMDPELMLETSTIIAMRRGLPTLARLGWVVWVASSSGVMNLHHLHSVVPPFAFPESLHRQRSMVNYLVSLPEPPSDAADDSQLMLNRLRR